MSIDGRVVESPYDVIAIVRAGLPAGTLTLEVRRGKDKVWVPVHVGATTG
jgi:S1-C subfamily serine protease